MGTNYQVDAALALMFLDITNLKNTSLQLELAMRVCVGPAIVVKHHAQVWE